MRISDWSSDVCSSDLAGLPAVRDDARNARPRLVLEFRIGRRPGQRDVEAVEIEGARGVDVDQAAESALDLVRGRGLVTIDARENVRRETAQLRDATGRTETLPHVDRARQGVV